MSAPTLWAQSKQQISFFIGLNDEAPKPREPVKPAGKLRVFNNYIKLLALLALCGYFIYLLIQLIANYVEDVNNPPLKVNQSIPKNKSEPFFPAVVFCNTGFNRTLDLVQVGFQERGNASSDLYCTPEPGDDYCEDGFPKDELQFWTFNIRHSDPSDSRRRRLGEAIHNMRQQQPRSPEELMMEMSNRRKLQGEEEEYEADVIPNTNGEYDIKCIAMDASAMSAFYPRKQPRPKELILLFSYQQAPSNIELVQTAGLRGLDIYFFNVARFLPGFAAQNKSQSFEGLYDTPDLISVDRFLDTSGDSYFLGQDTLTYMSISQSQYKEGSAPVVFQYSARSMAAPLNADNFLTNLTNSVVNNTNDDTQLSLIVLSYDTPLVTYYTREPPEFAEFLGSIGGLKSILFDFWAILLGVLVSINQMQAITKKKQSAAVGNAASKGENNNTEKGGDIVVAANGDDA